MQLRHALDAFLVQLQADGRSPHTADQYRRHVGLLDRWLAASKRPRDIAAIDHGTLALFLADDAARCRPDGETKRATSMNAMRTSLRSFFLYAHGAGFTPENPARLVRRARCSPPPPRTLSAAEVKRLLKAIDAGEGVAAARDRVLVGLLLGTGLRLGSALGLRVEDVDLRRGEVRVIRVKNDRPITLPISREVGRSLRAYLRTVPSGPLFPGAGGAPLTRRQAGRRIEEWAEVAGLRGRASAHVLRHVFACNLLRRTGGNLLVVQQALARKSISSTTSYARIDDTALRRALRA